MIKVFQGSGLPEKPKNNKTLFVENYHMLSLEEIERLYEISDSQEIILHGLKHNEQGEVINGEVQDFIKNNLGFVTFKV